MCPDLIVRYLIIFFGQPAKTAGPSLTIQDVIVRQKPLLTCSPKSSPGREIENDLLSISLPDLAKKSP